MPPQSKPIPLPRTDGKDAKEWLEAHGLVARRAMIRSSDYESMLHCPFQYYLSRRLCLVPALRWSAALSRGSWFHKRLEYYNLSPLEADKRMEADYETREEELRDVCKVRGIYGEERDRIFRREYQDMLCAKSWFEVAASYPVPGRGPLLGPGGYLSKSWWDILGTEIVAKYTHPEFGDMLAQFDMLLYHEEQNRIFIMDMKTCSCSTISRLQICPIEFQTQHYMHILKYLIEEGAITRQFNIPRDVKVGGMIHIAVQKPTIEFGQNDRDFEEHKHELSRGPRKGQIELRRKYHGEPKIENYIKRCKDWYFAEGQYEDKAPERESDPPVNYSLTPGSTLDTRYTTEYTRRLRLMEQYVMCDPHPVNFPKSARHLNQFGKLSPFAPFYLTPVSEWAGIVATGGFVMEDRDDVEPQITA